MYSGGASAAGVISRRIDVEILQAHMKNGTAVKPCVMTVPLLMSSLISNHCGADADGPAVEPASAAAWQTVETGGLPVARHECAFVEMDGKFYLLGGRSSLAVFSWFSLRLWGEKPVNVYDPASNAWSAAAEPPMEIHHFQPVVFENKIWVLGAMTGGYPHERPVAHILIYDPRADQWTRGAEIPSGRRRGSCGVVVHAGKIYMAGASPTATMETSRAGSMNTIRRPVPGGFCPTRPGREIIFRPPSPESSSTRSAGGGHRREPGRSWT